MRHMTQFSFVPKLKSTILRGGDLMFKNPIIETSFVQKNTSILGITSSLASYHLLYDNTSLINDEIEIYRSITREDIKEVANKYLNPNQRLDMDYVKKQ